jgi:hypothetical protein
VLSFLGSLLFEHFLVVTRAAGRFRLTIREFERSAPTEQAGLCTAE